MPSFIVGLLVLALLPLASSAGGLEETIAKVKQTLQQVTGTSSSGGSQATADASAPDPRVSVTEAERLRRERERLAAALRAEDPKTQPPMHGTNPHGQGTVAVVDLTPDPARPLGGDPAGSDSEEEIVVGRARGEQNEDGTYHGHITIAALFGQEILGVDTQPGQTEAGPLDAIQQGILTPLCDGSGNQICLSAVSADSSTNENGSTNHFSAAHATLGGQEGVDVGAAESNGNISDDGTCQTSHGDSTVASASVGGQALADVGKSSTDSRACKGQAPTQANSSTVIGLGGTGVPLPAPGCADGTPDTTTGIPTIAPIVCNGDDANTDQAGAPYGTRDALTVFLLDAGGGTILGKAMTAGSESRAQAPPAQCSDKADNDGDGRADAADPGCLSGPGGAYNPNDDNEGDEPKPACSNGADDDGDGVADAADPGCHTDGDAGNAASYDPNDNDETNAAGGSKGGGGGGGDDDDGGEASRAECSDGRDNDGDGLIDRRDPGCHTDGDASNPDSYDADDDSEDGGTAASGGPACSNGRDDDGDGLTDAADPGCHTDGNADNPASYDPDDTSEADPVRREAGAGVTSLPRTGSDALLWAIAGLLLLGGGIELRRRARAGGGA